MKSGHGANPVFFNKKNKDCTSRTLPNIPPATSHNISILLYPPLLLKVDVICVLPLYRCVYIKCVVLHFVLNYLQTLLQLQFDEGPLTCS